MRDYLSILFHSFKNSVKKKKVFIYLVLLLFVVLIFNIAWPSKIVSSGTSKESLPADVLQPARTTYYIAANGNDRNDGSHSNPWATFAHAMQHLQPGDTLVIKDGTYLQTLNVTVSGSQDRPITIRAENDGQAVIDGERVRSPCNIVGASGKRLHDIYIEGIRFQHSRASVVGISYSDRVTLRRVSAYDAGPGNNPIFSLYHVTNSLLEDTAASGSGRVMYNIYESPHVTLRRCWGRWIQHSGGGGPNAFMQLYGSDNDVVENCVGTMYPNAQDTGAPAKVGGIAVWANVNNASASYNRLYGNVVFGLSSWGYAVSSALHTIHGNQFSNNVSIANGVNGLYQRADDSLIATNFTITGTTGKYNSSCTCQQATDKYDPGWSVRGTLKNSILMNGQHGLHVSRGRCDSFSNTYNNYYNLSKGNWHDVASRGKGEISVNPGFDTAKYGKGGYLFLPASSRLRTAGENGGPVGAEVLYRCQSGSLTSIPLWPWPMEDRILKETGVSVTWENKGGLWKTLDGVYPAVSPIKNDYARGDSNL